jgi:hypothetical protein
MCLRKADSGSEPVRVTSSSTSSAVSGSVPSITPNTPTEGGSSGSALAPINRLAASSSGAVGAQDCHASITAAALEKDQAR